MCRAIPGRTPCRQGRSLALLAAGGGAVLATTALSAVTASAGHFGGGVRAAAIAVAVAINVVLFTVAFRVLTARSLSIAQVRTGAVAAAVVWQALQWSGAFLLGHTLKGATATYGMFGLVLGMLAWLYLGAATFVLGAEINVVRDRRLWPRSLLTPFTDNVELTSGDRRAYTSYAETERRKGFQNVDVDFDPPPRDAGADTGAGLRGRLSGPDAVASSHARPGPPHPRRERRRR
ncbi:YhjD/YihY/BrkB family envelope integrity protein [Actinomadura yumaensis]|uniref:YhjD/YihY/BrkB family envelope integrity protein n=1 Tax=Actinomadura yumaensis TaxID=111807 RepID=UPI003619B0C9